MDAEVSREDGEPCQRHLHSCSQAQEAVSWESLQPNLTHWSHEQKTEIGQARLGALPTWPSNSCGLLSTQGHSSCLSFPGSAGHCSCPFRPKGYTVFPLLLRASHVTKGCSNILMAFPDLFIVPFFVSSPLLPRLTVPSLSEWRYSFQGSFPSL